uniref:Uncharacterized protein n=1 Tax=Helianthus annuus TaxID=4232 RepID=A0A251S996_HELAN
MNLSGIMFQMKNKTKTQNPALSHSPKLLNKAHVDSDLRMRRNPKGNRNRSCKSNQLDVKGCRGVYASFDKYAEVERLEGDNKYHAEAHGLQDAKKGVLFNDFPHVLQLRLKRFEYDFTSDTMVNVSVEELFPLPRVILALLCSCFFFKTLVFMNLF